MLDQPEDQDDAATRLQMRVDERQTPLGYFNMALSYLDAADELTRRLVDKSDPFRLAFESPIRHLYAHAWELALKACLIRQGMKPDDVKKTFGHKLVPAWEAVDRKRFATLDLHDGTRIVPEVLDQFHPTKLYAYPVTGFRREFSLTYIRGASQRFRIDRPTILELFS